MLRQAETQNSHYGKTLAHLDLAYFAAQRSDFDEMYKQMAIASSAIDISDPPFLKGYTHYVEGVINYNTINNIQALQSYNKAIRYFEQTADSAMLTRTYLNKYSYHIVKGQPAEAKESLDKAAQWCTQPYHDIVTLYRATLVNSPATADSLKAWVQQLKATHSPMLNITSGNIIYWIYYYNNIISAFVQNHQPDSADRYCNQAALIAQQHGSDFEQYMALTNKAWMLQLHGQYDSSIALCRKVRQDFEGIYSKGLLKTSLKIEIACHQAQNDYKQAFQCLRQLGKADSLAAADIQLAENFINNQLGYEQRIAQLEDSHNHYRRIAALCLLALAAATALLIILTLKRRIKVQQAQMQQIEQERQYLLHRQELETVRMEQLTTREQVASVSEQIKTIASEMPKNIRSRLIQSISQLQENRDKWNWDDFQCSFSVRYPGFVEKIKHDHPSLTPLEIKICMLIKTDLSNKEIAATLHLAYNTVRTYRTHIRKKMHLKGDEDDLNNFIRRLN